MIDNSVVEILSFFSSRNPVTNKWETFLNTADGGKGMVIPLQKLQDLIDAGKASRV